MCDVNTTPAHQQEQYWRAMLEQRPDAWQAELNLSAALIEQARYTEAAACCRRVLRQRPAVVEAHLNLGSALEQSGRLEDASLCYRHAVQLRPTYAEAQNNLGVVLHQLGRFREAMECFDEAITLSPGFARPHVNRAMAYLLAGRYREGWQELEWRHVAPITHPRPLGCPEWNGEPAAGRTILLQSELGLGDTIQFARYAALVRQSGARVILECSPRLVPLFENSPDLDGVVSSHDPPPDGNFRIGLLSLPRLFYGKIPAPARFHLSGGRQPGGGRIGLSWRADPAHENHHKRSIPLETFAGLAKIPGLTFYSLQRDAGEAELASAGFKITNLERASGGILDTASAILDLNLVISADTMVAHLAGSLGTPVWVILPVVPDWRWLLERGDSPWYPGMRLFRQEVAGDWRAAMERVTRELAGYFSSHTLNLFPDSADG